MHIPIYIYIYTTIHTRMHKDMIASVCMCMYLYQFLSVCFIGGKGLWFIGGCAFTRAMSTCMHTPSSLHFHYRSFTPISFMPFFSMPFFPLSFFSFLFTFFLYKKFPRARVRVGCCLELSLACIALLRLHVARRRARSQSNPLCTQV